MVQPSQQQSSSRPSRGARCPPGKQVFCTPFPSAHIDECYQGASQRAEKGELPQ